MELLKQVAILPTRPEKQYDKTHHAVFYIAFKLIEQFTG
jgi:hypothetical protein